MYLFLYVYEYIRVFDYGFMGHNVNNCKTMHISLNIRVSKGFWKEVPLVIQPHLRISNQSINLYSNLAVICKTWPH